MYILDTNILIYALEARDDVLEFLSELLQDRFYFSVISRFEVLVGAERGKASLENVELFLSQVVNFDVDKRVIDEAVKLRSSLEKKLKINDLLIAATAKVHGATLVTADRDFQGLEGVKVELVELVDV